MKSLIDDPVVPYLSENEYLAMAGNVSKKSIGFLTAQINEIEAVFLGKVKLKPPYTNLLSVFGIRKILALTIKLETGPMT